MPEIKDLKIYVASQNKTKEAVERADFDDKKKFIRDFYAKSWTTRFDEPWEDGPHYPMLSKDSKICIIGGCFSRNLGSWLKEQGAEVGDIPWGLHYHTKAILREFQRTLKKGNTPDICWELTEDYGHRFADPFRHLVQADTKEGLAQKISEIEELKKEYFQKTDLFVVSLSLSEVWEEKIDGQWQPLGRGPTAENFDENIHRYRNLTSEETKRDIKEIISTIKEINPRAKIVFMVSPVPLKHSLHPEHIYISNNRSKTTLLNAVYEIMDLGLEDVFYFPAYEIVQRDYKSNCFQVDMRHLTAECIINICWYFVNLFYSDKTFFDKSKDKNFHVREVNRDGHSIKRVSENKEEKNG